MHPLIYIDLPYLVVGRYLSINSAETHCNQQCFKNCSDSNQIMCDYNHERLFNSQNQIKSTEEKDIIIIFRNDYLSLKILT